MSPIGNGLNPRQCPNSTDGEHTWVNKPGGGMMCANCPATKD